MRIDYAMIDWIPGVITMQTVFATQQLNASLIGTCGGPCVDLYLVSHYCQIVGSSRTAIHNWHQDVFRMHLK